MKKYLEFINESNENEFEDNREIIYDFIQENVTAYFDKYDMTAYNMMSENWARNSLTNYGDDDYNYDVHIMIYFGGESPKKEELEKFFDKYFKEYELTINNYLKSKSTQCVISFNLDYNFNSNIFKSVKSMKKFNL